MPRQARVVIPGAPHHVTQRGNRRQQTFFSDADDLAYLHLAGEAFRDAGVEVWAYCLMPNHIHLIATPSRPEALAEAVGRPTCATRARSTCGSGGRATCGRDGSPRFRWMTIVWSIAPVMWG